MRKILITLSVCFIALGLSAQTWEASAQYRTSKNFNTGAAQLAKRLSLNTTLGLQAQYSKEKAFKDPIYSIYVPFEWEAELAQISVTPFYYFKNKMDPGQHSYAYGVRSRLVMTLQEDTVNDLYSHAFLGVSFARQQGTLSLSDGTDVNQYYSQMAYTLGLHKNFFRSFSFEAAAHAFQYPDGISRVKSMRSILDQQDLAYTQSFDINHELAKYILSARLTRLWMDRRASFYIGYHFGEFYSAEEEHSFLIGDTFALTENIGAEVAYNHLRTIHNHNKRDILYVQIHVNF